MLGFFKRKKAEALARELAEAMDAETLELERSGKPKALGLPFWASMILDRILAQFGPYLLGKLCDFLAKQAVRIPNETVRQAALDGLAAFKNGMGLK